MQPVSDLGFALATDGTVIDPQTGEQSEPAARACRAWLERVTSNDGTWTPCAPGCAGLAVVDSDTYGCQIQRCDDCGRFASDDEAWAFALALGAPRWMTLRTNTSAGELRPLAVKVFDGPPSSEARAALVDLCEALKAVGAKGRASITARVLALPDSSRGTWILVTSLRDPEWIRGFVGGWLHRWGMEH